MDNYDVVVVGGGISGLATAAILAKEGRRCLVFEQLIIPGGRARVVEKNGFKIDYGIHVHRFADEGKAAETLRKCGIRRRFLPVGDPLIFHEGGFVKFPKKPADILTTPLLSFPSRLMMLKVFISAMTMKKTDATYNQTIADWMDGLGAREQDIREMVSLFSTAGLVCGDIDRASTGEFVDFLRTAIKAKEATGYYLGGWESIIDRMITVIENAGGEVRTDTKVDSVVVEEGVALGVSVNEDEIRARAVVMAMPLQQSAAMLKPDYFAPDVLERIRSIEPTAGISIDFCLSKRVSDIEGIIFTCDPCTMGMFTSNVEPALAPRGKQLGTWYYPLPRSAMNDKEFVKNERVRFKGLIETMFPGIWRHVEYERIIDMDIVDGAVPVAGQTHKDRPGVDCSLVRNLFFCGDSTGVPGNGGDVAFNSAIVCAQKISQSLV